MRLRLLMIGLILLLTAACQGNVETRVVVVVSPTPDPNRTPEVTVLIVTATPDAATTADAENVSAEATNTTETNAATATNEPVATVTSANTSTARPSNTPNPTATISGLPTPVVTRIQVAEQVFQGGRMFWLQPAGEFWVMFADPEVEGHGRWAIYQDTFEEGVDPESDPSIVPPESDLYQPVRGFGKLWRENEEIRDALGWGVTPEFGYVSPYEYHLLINNGELVRDPNGQPIGYHILFSLDQEAFRFNEIDSTWQLNID